MPRRFEDYKIFEDEFENLEHDREMLWSMSLGLDGIFRYPSGFGSGNSLVTFDSIESKSSLQRGDLPHLETNDVKCIKNLVFRKIYKNYPALAIEGDLNGTIITGKLTKIHTSKLLIFKNKECLSLSSFDSTIGGSTIEFVYENFKCDPELSEYILPLKENNLSDIDLYICTFFKDGWFMFVPRVLVRVFFNTKNIDDNEYR